MLHFVHFLPVIFFSHPLDMFMYDKTAEDLFCMLYGTSGYSGATPSAISPCVKFKGGANQEIPYEPRKLSSRIQTITHIRFTYHKDVLLVSFHSYTIQIKTSNIRIVDSSKIMESILPSFTANHDYTRKV